MQEENNDSPANKEDIVKQEDNRLVINLKSNRSSRKRNIVDYASLSEGITLPEIAVKPKRRISISLKGIDLKNQKNLELNISNKSLDNNSLKKSFENSIETTTTICKPIKAKNSKDTSPTSTVTSHERLTNSECILDTIDNANKHLHIADAISNLNEHQNIKTTTLQENKRKNSKRAIKVLKEDSAPVENIFSSLDNVICAVCNKKIEKSVWTYHNMRYHNNLAWKVGDEPLDLNDQQLVLQILNDLYKRKKPLYCETCGHSRKSVQGYLSHKATCQKSTEEISSVCVQCEHCGKVMLPVSLYAHNKFCRVLNPYKPPTNFQDLQHPDEMLLGKRKAARKADTFIKEIKDRGLLDNIEKRTNNTRKWYIDFDFRPTAIVNKIMQKQIIQNNVAKCTFKDCNYETNNFDEMLKHLTSCEKKPEKSYTCKLCLKVFENESDVAQHSETDHTDLFNDDFNLNDEDVVEEDDNEDAIDSIPEQRICKMPAKLNYFQGIQFLLKHRFCSRTAHTTYSPAREWALQFCEKHFSNDNLFPEWRTTVEPLSIDQIVKYLPHVRYSVCTDLLNATKYVDLLKLNYNWRRYRLFECDTMLNGSAIMFCGGSIFSLAWAPTPHNQKSCGQYLAVSTNINMDKDYRFDKVYHDYGIVQIWNCGILSNSVKEVGMPKFEFCIAHNHGPVWCLEWCPSGCYDINFSDQPNDVRRLGLLAMGSGDCFVYIYSVCLPNNNAKKLYTQKPIMKLALETLCEEIVNGLQAHVTSISWSKAAGHQYIAVGYANGMAAMFRLNSTSSLLRFQNEDGTETLLPYRIVNAHYHAVTTISLYHLNDGCRWLMTGSIDRSIKYWDLDNPTVPITNIMKVIVTDGVWLNHWVSSIHAFDDCCESGLTSTIINQVRNFKSDPANVMYSNSRVATITGSEWLNGFVQGNVVGEIQGFFPQQMFFQMSGDKSYKNKRVVLGYTRTVEKDPSVKRRLLNEQEKLSRHENVEAKSHISFSIGNEPENLRLTKDEPIHYKDADEKYGLVFCDMQVTSMKDFPDNTTSYHKSNGTDKFFATRPNEYPMQAVNKTAFNPNNQSYLNLAIGYNAGFIRILNLNFFN